LEVDADIRPRRSWRDECVAWARGELSDFARDDEPLPPPSVQTIEALVARFELPAYLVAGVALLYGAHLAGHDGVAPADLARMLQGRWDEALGGGVLAASGLVIVERSRVRFATSIERALDELPPVTGMLVGVPDTNALLGACVIVTTDPLAAARRHASRAGGAILVGYPDRTRAEVCLEARAIGAAPMLPAALYGDGSPAVHGGDAAAHGGDAAVHGGDAAVHGGDAAVHGGEAPVLYAATDDDDADRLGLPRF
jgi:hypothetical protein